MNPKVFIFNGGSSVGKTTLCKAVQDSLPEPSVLLGIDVFWLSLPPKQLDLDRVDPEYYSWRYEKESEDEEYFRIIPGPLLNENMAARYEATVAYLRRGFTVVADEVFWKFEWAVEAYQAFDGYEAYLIGVYCDEDVLEQREKARGDRYPGWGRGSQHFAHRDMRYDMTIDTSHMPPSELAKQVLSAIEGGLKPRALNCVVNHRDGVKATCPCCRNSSLVCQDNEP